MTTYRIDPITDARWAEFVERNPSSSVFHSLPWLQAVKRTYGYEPAVLTTTPPSTPLTNGILFCQVKSWLTGRRLVSLPFSDHCEPLTAGTDALTEIARELKASTGAGKWKYVELRPVSEMPLLSGAATSFSCMLHMLDISAPAADILRKTHKTSIQQPIKRAEREGIEIERGSSEPLLKAFYDLMVKTRRRHQVPPQPIAWFRNLGETMGERMKIRVARLKGEPIASILTLQHKNTLIYKYSASDNAFNNLGATPYLIWDSIVDGKASGCTAMDLGRSETDKPGLIDFKRRWGATAMQLNYLRWSGVPAGDAARGRLSGLGKRVFGMMPDFVLQMTGRILYRHIG